MVEIITSIALFIAAVFDFKTMRIPNVLQVIALLAVTVIILITDPHSWRLRAISSLILVLFFLVLTLLKQSGGGDLKMMMWFGAGFGLDAFGVLIFGMVFMALWTLWKIIARKQKSWLPLAPALAVGLLIWEVLQIVKYGSVWHS